MRIVQGPPCVRSDVQGCRGPPVTHPAPAAEAGRTERPMDAIVKPLRPKV